MKVICIDNKYRDHLTLNKIYEVIDDIELFYRIVDDTGCQNGFFKDRFKDLSLWRDEQINLIINADDIK